MDQQQQAQISDIVVIDGSSNEGGGQIINIRKARPNPGINNQLKSVVKNITHATQQIQIDLMKQIVPSNVQGDKIGSQEILFEPLQEQIKGGKFECGGKTAQSITLMFQCLLPIFIFANEPTHLTLKGGTIVSKSPPAPSVQNLLVGLLSKMGIDIKCDTTKEGYFPGGGGIMKVQISPCAALNAIELMDSQAKIKSARLEFVLTKDLPVKEYVNEYSKEKKNTIAKIDSSRTNSDSTFDYTHDLKIIGCKKFKECYGVIAHVKAEPNVFDCSLICMDDEPLERVFEKVMKKLVFELSQDGNCLDEFHQDQLLIYMALANGVSRIQIGKHVTEHTRAALYVLNKFIPKLEYEILQGSFLTLIMKGINLK